MADEDSRDDDRAKATGPGGGSPPGGGGGAAAAARAPRGGGFFTIYKKGQGYWTRMGTALAAAGIAALTGEFVYTQMAAIPYAEDAERHPLYIARSVCAGAGAAVFAIIMFFAWRAMNKPANADFLIATDSEMKKVNWTTRKELIGSTRVVIFFVILISALLFLLDVVFGYFFHLIKVLEFGPFQ